MLPRSERLDMLPEELGRAEVAVYLFLATMSNKDGEDCYPSRKKIAACVKYSVETVKRAIKRLSEHGLIEVVSGKNSGSSNGYRVGHLPMGGGSPMTHPVDHTERGGGSPMTHPPILYNDQERLPSNTGKNQDQEAAAVKAIEPRPRQEPNTKTKNLNIQAQSFNPGGSGPIGTIGGSSNQKVSGTGYLAFIQTYPHHPKYHQDGRTEGLWSQACSDVGEEKLLQATQRYSRELTSSSEGHVGVNLWLREKKYLGYLVAPTQTQRIIVIPKPFEFLTPQV